MSEPYYLRARANAQERFASLKFCLQEAETLVGNSACVYSTGSFGRSEAGPFSDLDLFIVIAQEKDSKKLNYGKEVSKRSLTNINETKLRCHLIRAVENSDIAPFDGDGKYLESHLFSDFVKYLGSQEDDYRNTFTGRMLLLLESKPVIGANLYDNLIDRIISKYFRNYQDNREDFLPSYLANDILRMWRTFCVNYEFNRRESEPKYKVKNLKLKFSRMLTCYSAIVYMLSIFGRFKTFSPEDAKRMVAFTPTERFEQVKHAHATTSIDLALCNSLELYSEFLEFAHLPEVDLERRIVDETLQWRMKSHSFAQAVADSIEALGSVEGQNQLHRIVLI